MLSLIIPTLNEAQNIGPLLESLRKAVGGLDHEFIVVDDDSPDRTWEVAQGIPGAVVIRRVGKRDLSSAVVEGFDAAKGDVLMVMDADGQHDSSLILKLYDAIAKEGKKLAVASRYVHGGGTEGWSGMRLFMSRVATGLARNVPPVYVSDPMSGFFAIKRETYQAIAKRLHPKGFKILLEMLGHLPSDTPVGEVPLLFGLRTRGQSKMTMRVQLQFLAQLAGIALRRALPSSRSAVFLCAAASILLGAAMLPELSRTLPLLDPAVRAKAPLAVEELRAQGIWVVNAEMQRIEKRGEEVCFTWGHRYRSRTATWPEELLETCL